MSKGRRTATKRIAARCSPVPPALDTLRQALGLFQAGQGAQAEPLCRTFVQHHPDHPDALTLLGVILGQSGRPAEAADLLGRAATLTPNDGVAHNNHGNALRSLGKYLSALACYDRALALRPDYAEAYYNRGVTLYDLGSSDEAIANFDRALALRPRWAAAWNNRGTALRALGRLQEALSSYDRALNLNSNHAEAHNNRATVLCELERYEEALSECEQALALQPRYAHALNNRGIVLGNLGRVAEALESYELAIAINTDAETFNGRGVTLHSLERYHDALESYDRALALRPEYAAAHANRAATLRMLHRFTQALAVVDRALAINPRNMQAHVIRGSILHDLRRFPEALASFDRALSLGKCDAATYRNHGMVLAELKCTEDAITSYEHALELEPHAAFVAGTCRNARMQLCDWRDFERDVAHLTEGVEQSEPLVTPFGILSLLDSPAVQLKTAEIFARDFCTPRVALAPLAQYPRHDRIRIGYFSADFRNHAVSMLTAGLFETHDRSRFELSGFALGTDARDELRSRVESSFERFLDVGDQSDHEIAERARALQLDIAVDLGGYTESARPRILALRCAPIQVSYIGYLGTMGAPFMDYLIADPVLVPPANRQHYREKLAYLPSYQANDSKRPTPQRAFSREELGLPPAGFVFCCFNDSYKITPETFSSWMRILAAVPDSVLFLLGDQPTVQRNLRNEAVARSVAPERLVFGTRVAYQDYLARYRAADLFLDTLPYNAGTTASDALWAGLPVLTCPGDAFAARMAASVLTAAGLPELIARDRADYERIAIELATQADRLAYLRRKLADNRATARLFDTCAFTRSLESLYERIYLRHLAGLAPDHLELE